MFLSTINCQLASYFGSMGILFYCLCCCFTSQSTVLVMSGRCLHFMRLLPNFGDEMTSEICYLYRNPSKPVRIILCMGNLTKLLFMGRLGTSSRLTSNQMVGQLSIHCAWGHKQPTYFSRPRLTWGGGG